MEVYRDEGGSAGAAGASAPTTRRGLSGSNGIGDGGARRAQRKGTALTPKKPSDMNKGRRRKSLREKKVAMAFGSSVDKAVTTTTTIAKENKAASSFGTSTSKIRTPESKIVKPKASLSHLLGLSSCLGRAGAPESLLSMKSTEVSQSTTTNTIGKPTTQADDASSKARSINNSGIGNSTTGAKASTPPSRSSSSDLRKFIQQRREEIRSSVEKEDMHNSGGNVIVDADDVGTAVTTTKAVRFETDVVAKLAKMRGKGEGGGETSLLDLTDEFRREVPPTTGTTFAAKPKEAVAPEAQSKTPSTTKALPMLSLGRFQESLWLDFGDENRNIVGKTRSMSFLLEAPQNDAEKSSSSGYYSVEFERVPFKKGFNLIVEEDDTLPSSSGNTISAGARTNGNDDAGSRLVIGNNSTDDDNAAAGSDRTSPTVLCIKNGDRKRLRLTWTPIGAGGVREVVHLKLPRGRIRITAHGKARAIDIVKKSKKRATIKTVRLIAFAWERHCNSHIHVYTTITDSFHFIATYNIGPRQGKLCQGISPFVGWAINASSICSETRHTVCCFDASTGLFNTQDGVLQVFAWWQHHIGSQGSSSNKIRWRMGREAVQRIRQMAQLFLLPDGRCCS